VGGSVNWNAGGSEYGKNRIPGTQEMKHRTLGHTGLIVSEVALGSMQFGGKMNMGNLGQEDTTRMVKLALDRGINFIDTADVYSLGESETLLGNALKGGHSLHSYRRRRRAAGPPGFE
jgi:predicted aldo/keto reductase-like oxidoreductase